MHRASRGQTCWTSAPLKENTEQQPTVHARHNSAVETREKEQLATGHVKATLSPDSTQQSNSEQQAVKTVKQLTEQRSHTAQKNEVHLPSFPSEVSNRQAKYIIRSSLNTR